MGLGTAVLTRRYILYGADTMSTHPHPALRICLACCSSSAPLRPVLCVLSGGGVQAPRGHMFLISCWNLGEVSKPELVLDSFPGLSSGLEAHEGMVSPQMPAGPGTDRGPGMRQPGRSRPRRPGLALGVLRGHGWQRTRGGTSRVLARAPHRPRRIPEGSRWPSGCGGEVPVHTQGQTLALLPLAR